MFATGVPGANGLAVDRRGQLWVSDGGTGRRPMPGRGGPVRVPRGRASSTHYPLCPAGQLVRRVGEYPSCWNSVDIDSENHRTHVTFPDRATGACPAGTVAIPRLRITLGYRVPPGCSFALDSFPDQARKAVTDHFDFENVMPESLMSVIVDASTPAVPADPNRPGGRAAERISCALHKPCSRERGRSAPSA